MSGGSAVVVVGGVVLAAAAWAGLFLPPLRGFWLRASAAGAAIGAYGAVAERHRLRRLLGPTPADVAIGVGGAVVLYGLFWAGHRLLRAVLPGLAAQVDELYAIRALPEAVAGRGPLAMSLVLCVVGPCEELFWRGLVQARAGWALALAGYAAVHLWERKAVLVMAAGLAGGFWAALFAWRGTLVAPIVSHALWDLAVVVWFPFAGRDAES